MGGEWETDTGHNQQLRTEPKAAGIVPLRRFPETSNHDKARTVPIEGSSIPSSKLLARMTVL